MPAACKRLQIRITLLFMLVLLFALPSRTWAAEFTASDLATLQIAVNAAKTVPDANSTILVTNTIAINRAYTLSGKGKKLTVKRAEGFLLDVFAVSKGGRLTLEDVTIDGNGDKIKNATGALLYNAGTVAIKDGAVLKNNRRVNNASGQANGGAITNTGALTMQGGSITGNSAQTGGGGIFNFGGKATITGGAQITGNTARLGGGVVNADNARFTMSGDAVLSGNTAFQGGGAVNAGEKAQFILSGNAVITGNTADYGAGMMNANTLTISGKAKLGVDDADNGLYLGLYHVAHNADAAIVKNGSLRDGARINIEGGVDIDGDGRIPIGARKSGMAYFHLINTQYQLAVSEKNTLVLTQYALEQSMGEGIERRFTIQAAMQNFIGVVLNYSLKKDRDFTLAMSGERLTITFSQAYVKALGEGDYFVRFLFTNGKAECIFHNALEGE